MHIMILSIMYYFTTFGDLCDSDSFHLYGFPGSTTHYDKKFILLLLTSFISEIKLFLFFLFLFSAQSLLRLFQAAIMSEKKYLYDSEYARICQKFCYALRWYAHHMGVRKW